MTPDQQKVLAVIQASDPESGLLTGEIARRCGQPTRYATPKLKALAKLGHVRRYDENVERWHYVAPPYYAKDGMVWK